uniref:m7GpppX diphosphatase n=1 Tax=Lygus hesperus TaxID=30085 RepID=A0A146M2G9_LYGHE
MEAQLHMTALLLYMTALHLPIPVLTVALHTKTFRGIPPPPPLIHYSNNSCSIGNSFKHRHLPESTALSIFEGGGCLESCQDAQLGDIVQNSVYCSGKVPTTEAPKGWSSMDFYIIYPCTDTHIRKHSSVVVQVVLETAAQAASKHEHLSQIASPTTWIDNIFAYKRESDRIVVEDLDMKVGYVVLPDTSWSTDAVKLTMQSADHALPVLFQSSKVVDPVVSWPVTKSIVLQLESAVQAAKVFAHQSMLDVLQMHSQAQRSMHCSNLHYLCIIRRNDLRSLRDLRADHLPLLHALQSLVQFLTLRHRIFPECLVAFFHYPPSFYHLHLHIHSASLIAFQNPARVHLLSSVITNLTLFPLYYQTTSLPTLVHASTLDTAAAESKF